MFELLTIAIKRSILDSWQGTIYASSAGAWAGEETNAIVGNIKVIQRQKDHVYSYCLQQGEFSGLKSNLQQNKL